MDKIAPRAKERIVLYRFHSRPENDPYQLTEIGYLTDEAFTAYNGLQLEPAAATKSNILTTFWNRMRRSESTPALPKAAGFFAKQFSPDWSYFNSKTTLIEVIIEPGTRIFDWGNTVGFRKQYPDLNFEDPGVMPAVQKRDHVYVVKVQEGVQIRKPVFQTMRTNEILQNMRQLMTEQNQSAKEIYEALFNQLVTRTDFTQEDVADLPESDKLKLREPKFSELESEFLQNQAFDMAITANKFFGRNIHGTKMAEALDQAVKSDRYQSVHDQSRVLELIQAAFTPRKREKFSPLGAEWGAQIQAHYEDVYADPKDHTLVEIREVLSRSVSTLLASPHPLIAAKAAEMLDVRKRWGFGARQTDVEDSIVVALNRTKDAESFKRLSAISRFHGAARSRQVHTATVAAFKRVNPEGMLKHDILADMAETIYREYSVGGEKKYLRRFIDMTLSDDPIEVEVGHIGLDTYANSNHGTIHMLELAPEIPFQLLYGMIEGVNGPNPRSPYVHLRGLYHLIQRGRVNEEARSFFWTLAVHGPDLLSKFSINEILNAFHRNPPPINEEWAKRFDALSKTNCQRAVTVY